MTSTTTTPSAPSAGGAPPKPTLSWADRAKATIKPSEGPRKPATTAAPLASTSQPIPPTAASTSATTMPTDPPAASNAEKPTAVQSHPITATIRGEAAVPKPNGIEAHGEDTNPAAIAPIPAPAPKPVGNVWKDRLAASVRQPPPQQQQQTSNPVATTSNGPPSNPPEELEQPFQPVQHHHHHHQPRSHPMQLQRSNQQRPVAKAPVVVPPPALDDSASWPTAMASEKRAEEAQSSRASQRSPSVSSVQSHGDVTKTKKAKWVPIEADIRIEGPLPTSRNRSRARAGSMSSNGDAYSTRSHGSTSAGPPPVPRLPHPNGMPVPLADRQHPAQQQRGPPPSRGGPWQNPQRRPPPIAIPVAQPMTAPTTVRTSPGLSPGHQLPQKPVSVTSPPPQDLYFDRPAPMRHLSSSSSITGSRPNGLVSPAGGGELRSPTHYPVTLSPTTAMPPPPAPAPLMHERAASNSSSSMGRPEAANTFIPNGIVAGPPPHHHPQAGPSGTMYRGGRGGRGGASASSMTSPRVSASPNGPFSKGPRGTGFARGGGPMRGGGSYPGQQRANGNGYPAAPQPYTPEFGGGNGGPMPFFGMPAPAIMPGPMYGAPGLTAMPPLPPAPFKTDYFPPLSPIQFYLLGQVEYYLSPDNLAQDLFLRQQMDTEGFIDMSVVLSFKRIQYITAPVPPQHHIDLLRDTIALSPLIDVDFENAKFRTKSEWQRWIMPGAKAALPRSTAEDGTMGGHQSNKEGSSKEHSASEDGDGDNDGTVATGTTGLTSPALSSTSKPDEAIAGLANGVKQPGLLIGGEAKEVTQQQQPASEQ